MCSPFSCIVKHDLTLIVGRTLAHHSHSQMLQDVCPGCGRTTVMRGPEIELRVHAGVDAPKPAPLMATRTKELGD